MVTPTSSKPRIVFAVLSLISVALFLASLPASSMVLTSFSTLEERSGQTSNPYFSDLNTVSGLQTGGDNDFSSWMSKLSDDLAVTEINLPGTHDSTARYGGDNYACQSLSLPDQLVLGVRFFDIRLTLADGVLKCQHGRVYQNLKFSDVLETMESFLGAHPSEAVFLKIQQEHTKYSPIDFSSAVSAAIGSSHTIFNASQPITNATLPTLSQIRGQMMIVPRFFSLPLLNTIPYEATTAQDDFKDTLVDKAASIISFFNQIPPVTGVVASISGTNSTIETRRLHGKGISLAQKTRVLLAQQMNLTWYVNHFSLHNNLQTPAAAAYVLNPLIAEMIPSSVSQKFSLSTREMLRGKFNFREASPVVKKMGVVMMDFIGVESSRLIIESNFA